MILATIRDLLGRSHRPRWLPAATVSADSASYADLRRCAACGRVLPLTAFRPRATTGRARRRACRPCEREIARRNRDRARRMGEGVEMFLGWHDPDTKRPALAKLSAAVSAYEEKFGCLPRVALCSPVDYAALPEGDVWVELGVTTHAVAYIPPNVFYVGMEANR